MEQEIFINPGPLFISTIFSFLSVQSTFVEKMVFKWLSKETQEERKLLIEKQNLENDQKQISMVDEFAKYSKIQRKINKIDESLKEIKSNKPTENLLVKFGFSYGVKFVLGLILLIFCIYYRYTPVFALSKNIDLTPFTRLICYPNGTNQISFYFWAMCCAAVTRIICK